MADQTIVDLGRIVKQKHPEYSDMDDAAVGAKVKAKFPGSYDDFKDVQAAPAEPPSALSRFGTGLYNTTLGPIGQAISHPIDTAVSTFSRLSGIDDIRKALASGDPKDRLKAVASFVEGPGQKLGAGIIQPIEDDLRAGNIAGAFGQVAGQAAILGSAKLLPELPAASRVGEAAKDALSAAPAAMKEAAPLGMAMSLPGYVMGGSHGAALGATAGEVLGAAPDIIRAGLKSWKRPPLPFTSSIDPTAELAGPMQGSLTQGTTPGQPLLTRAAGEISPDIQPVMPRPATDIATGKPLIVKGKPTGAAKLGVKGSGAAFEPPTPSVGNMQPGMIGPINPNPSMPDVVLPRPTGSLAPPPTTFQSGTSTGPALLPTTPAKTTWRGPTTEPNPLILNPSSDTMPGPVPPVNGSGAPSTLPPPNEFEMNRMVRARATEYNLPGSPAGKSAGVSPMLDKAASTNFGASKFGDLNATQMKQVYDWLTANKSLPTEGQLKAK